MGKSTSYLNFLRIFSAVLVILLHCIAPFYSSLVYFENRSWWICGVLNSVTRTAVPMFFMMSGYLMLTNPKTLDIKKFYKKRLPRLIIPLTVWNIIYYIYYNNGNLSLSDFFNELLGSGAAYHLWFVYSMLGFYLILPFLKRITDNCTDKQLLVLLTVLSFTGTIRPLINTVFPVYIWFFDVIANGYIPYFILGYLLGKSSLNFKNRIIVYIGGVLGAFMSIFGNWYYSSSESISLIANEAYRLNHALCACAIWILFKQINWDKFTRLCNAAENWSKRTFGIYFIHALVLDISVKYVPNSFAPGESIIYRFLITTIFSFFITYIIDKIKPLSKLLM